MCLNICSLVIFGYPIQDWHLSLLKEHRMLKLLGMVLSCFLGIVGSCNGLEVGSVLWLILFFKRISALLITSS